MPGLPTVVAAAQHGLLTSAQLSSAGFSSNQVGRLTSREHLERLAPRLYRIAGAPNTTEQRMMAAVLGLARAPLSMSTWFAGCRNTTSVLLMACQRVAARALIELAGLPGVHPGRVERAIDNAWSQRLVTGPLLHRMLNQLEGRWPGIDLMRGLLADGGKGYIPPASGLECRVIQILRKAGEPPLRPQADCGDEVGWIARVDFIDNDLPFVLEVQKLSLWNSFCHHDWGGVGVSGLAGGPVADAPRPQVRGMVT